MKTLPLFTLLAFLLFSCSQPKHDGFVINGLTDLPDGTLLYLSESKYDREKDEMHSETIDSTTVSDGSFMFKGKIASGFTTVAVFRKDQNDLRKMYLGDHTVTLDARNTSLQESIVTGAPIQDQSDEHLKFYKAFDVKLDSINDLADEITIKDDSLLGLYAKAYHDIEAAQLASTADFIKSHPDYELSSFLLMYLRHEVSEEKTKELYEGLNPNVQASLYGDVVLEHIRKSIKIQTGTQAPEIILRDSTGREIKLSSLKGKYVLIDFWSSWCGPCRGENVNLVKVYKDYKEKGFEIVSVSVDEKESNWKKAMKEDKISWISVLDSKGEYEKLYNISSFPTNYLIDPQGKIIDKYLRGSALSNKLEEIFKNLN